MVREDWLKMLRELNNAMIIRGVIKGLKVRNLESVSILYEAYKIMVKAIG